MDRRERIFRDRAEMARRALIEAKYLTGEEAPEELRSKLKEVAGDFLADLFHLFPAEDLTQGKRMLQEILMAATKEYENDIIHFRFSYTSED